MKTENPLYVDRVKEPVNQSLQAKGWQLMPSGGETTVFATGEIYDERQLETMCENMGSGWGGWGWGGGSGLGTATTSTITQQVGSFVIDIFTASDKKLIWRGII